jgi:hypothetical protein
LKQTPDALQVSAPLQNTLSLHGVRFASFAVQFFAPSLQLSLQFGPVLWPGHGFPACVTQVPPLHVSAPLQNTPSLHPAVFGSLDVQLSAASLHDPAQFASAVLSGRHGSPV